MAVPAHPYYPRNLAIPHYVPNDQSLPAILGCFFTFVGVVLVVTWVQAGRQPHIAGSLAAKLKLCWFMGCGLIHFILEGYFSVFHKSFPGRQDVLAQIWKEYSKGDSRYVLGDSFTVIMESVTAFVDGPLALLLVFLFTRNSPCRYVVQLVLSVCQLYGDVLYFATEWKEDFAHGPLYHPLYFWFYFFFMNFIWIVVPSICIVEAVGKLVAAQRLADRGGRKKLQ